MCLGQRTNKDKCIKTTIQCEQEQDACKTQIRWQRKYFYILCQAYWYFISVSITFLDRIPLEKFQLSWYHINLFIKGEIKGENKWNLYFCMYRIECTSLLINNFEIFYIWQNKLIVVVKYYVEWFLAPVSCTLTDVLVLCYRAPLLAASQWEISQHLKVMWDKSSLWCRGSCEGIQVYARLVPRLGLCRVLPRRPV